MDKTLLKSIDNGNIEKDDLVRIHIHKELEKEMQEWLKIFEARSGGYDSFGGRPIVSKFAAIILKELRVKDFREKKHIIIEFHKMSRTKKCKVTFL